jgi:hypothetical protein
VAVQAVPAEEEGVAQENGWMAHGHQNGKKSEREKIEREKIELWC